MLFKLSKLENFFRSHKLSNELYSIYALYKIAGYEDEWMNKVLRHAKKNPKPFSEWFGGKDRLYFDFAPIMDIQNIEADDDVRDVLEIEGYQIIDYFNGYCQKNNTKFKIGKVLEKMKQKELKEFKENPNLSEEQKVLAIQEAEDYWKNIFNKFLNSEHRQNSKNFNNLQIVISQNPHDIAKMSYERGWTSCMNLDDGSQHENVFCEVESGGLIAYLIRKDDPEIKNPIARILIHRFIGLNGVNIAKAETAVYGTKVSGFFNFVSGWIEGKNKERFEKLNIPSISGLYEKKGGEYSDSFNEELFITPNSLEELTNWFHGKTPESRKSYYKVTDKYYDLIPDYYWEHADLPQNYDGTAKFETLLEANRFINYIKNFGEDDWYQYVRPDVNSDDYAENESDKDYSDEDLELLRFEIIQKTKDYSSNFKIEAASKLISNHIQEISQDLAKELLVFSLNTPKIYTYANKILQSFPQLLTPEIFDSFSQADRVELMNIYSLINPKFADYLYPAYKADIKETLTFGSDKYKKRLEFNTKIYPYDQIKAKASALSFEISSFISSSLKYDIDEDMYKFIKEFIFNKIHKIPEFNHEEGKNFISTIYDRIVTDLNPKNININNLVDLATELWKVLDVTAWRKHRNFSVETFSYFVLLKLDKHGVIFKDNLKWLLEHAEEHIRSNKSYQHDLIYFKEFPHMIDNLEKDATKEIANRVDNLSRTIKILERQEKK